MNCNDVIIEVQELDSFADFGSMDVQFDADGNVVSRGVAPGGSDSSVLIRTAYQYQFLTPGVGSLLSGGDGVVNFISTIVLQTEPYDFDGV